MSDLVLYTGDGKMDAIDALRILWNERSKLSSLIKELIGVMSERDESMQEASRHNNATFVSIMQDQKSTDTRVGLILRLIDKLDQRMETCTKRINNMQQYNEEEFNELSDNIERNTTNVASISKRMDDMDNITERQRQAIASLTTLTESAMARMEALTEQVSLHMKQHEKRTGTSADPPPAATAEESVKEIGPTMKDVVKDIAHLTDVVNELVEEQEQQSNTIRVDDDSKLDEIRYELKEVKRDVEDLKLGQASHDTDEMSHEIQDPIDNIDGIFPCISSRLEAVDRVLRDYRSRCVPSAI